jgi:hypothetical protein
MKKHARFVWTMALLVAIFGMIPLSAPAQEKTYAEIAGDYNLDLGNRLLPFKVVLKDAKLFFDAQTPDQNPQPMTPVQGKDLTFTTFDPNGDEFSLAFIRNDQKKITGCTVSLPSRGVEAKATKVEK